MEQLGLGVRLELDDDMTQEINPIVRDLERLRRQAQATTRSFNDMRTAHDPFGRNRRQNIEDYYASMQSTDRALLSISDRLIRATKSANSLSRAMNRAQFGGNFNMMYRDMVRVQTMLGNMGYGMSKMQREMSNLRAYNMMDVQIKDLQDRIKLTTKALKEMQSSPDASKMVKEMNVAKRALQAYQNELSRVGNLQNKLAETHNLGTMKSFTGAKDILYEKEDNLAKNVQNRIGGLLMGDIAIASAIASKSLIATERALIGVGNTALEAKQKLTQMSTAMTTLGMTLTTTLSLVSALGLGGWGFLANRHEKANAQFTGQSLTPIKESGQYQASMREVFQTSSGSDRESLARMFSTMQNANVGLGDMKVLSGGANEIAYAQGLDSVDVLNSALSIAKETGSSFNDTLDLLSLGLKSTNGDLEGATEAVLANAGAFKTANGEWKNAFETLEQGNKDGSINRLIQSAKGLSNVMVTLWDKGMKQVVGGFADLVNNMTLATDKFLEAHPAVAKLTGSMLGLALVTGLIVGPILLVTGFLVRYRSAIQSVGLAVQALSARGGVAVLGAQSTMLAKNVHSATVALARFPQTLLFGVLPALYSTVRMLPNFLLNMARINPVMAGLTVGMLAYSQNWFGFGDSVKSVTQSVKDSIAVAKGAIGTAMSGGDVDMNGLSTFEQVLAKTMGTAKIAKDVIKSIFTGEELKFSIGEANLIEQLGIGGMVNSIATAGKSVKDFADGFVDGIQLVYDKAKMFVGWMTNTFEPVIVRIGNFISKLFGGSGDAKSIEDIMNSATGLNSTMSSLGKIAGIALTALLGFKVLKPLFSGLFKGLVKNPFAGIISSANLARKAITGMTGAVGKGVGTVVSRNRTQDTSYTNNAGGGVIVPRNRGSASSYAYGRENRRGNSQIHAQPTMSPLVRSGSAPMTPTQQRLESHLVSNRNARARGYDVGASTFIGRGQNQLRDTLGNNSRINRDGTYNNPTNANLNGRQIHQRKQGAISRALFGQAYDVHDEQGRRTTINRQGGLLRRTSSDNQTQERMGLRDRTSVAMGNVRTKAKDMGSTIANNVSHVATQAKTGAKNIASTAINSNAMKPVTVPVRYVNQKIVQPIVKPIKGLVQWTTGRLQTAGVIRQGQQGGAQAGGRFRRAFNLATRTLGTGGRMFSGAVSGATSAGRKAGSGMIKGMNFVSKGIGGIFKLGLRAIPFLGWALMAWDIVSTVFTNWDKIKAGAQKAWEWIQTSGVEALDKAWEWIKEKALSVWSWIQENGKSTAISIAEGFITFIGNAFTTILPIVGSALMWILTDGIAIAMQLGATFIKWVAMDAFPRIVTFAGSVLTGFISTAGSIASSIGSAMWNGITSALSGLGNWLGEQISKVPGGSFVVEKLTGKKYARGGIINSPHMGIVGEAGPEAIIPLSGNQRDRARNLMQHTAGILGMSLTPKNEAPREDKLIQPKTEALGVAVQPTVVKEPPKPTVLGLANPPKVEPEKTSPMLGVAQQPKIVEQPRPNPMLGLAQQPKMEKEKPQTHILGLAQPIKEERVKPQPNMLGVAQQSKVETPEPELNIIQRIANVFNMPVTQNVGMPEPERSKEEVTRVIQNPVVREKQGANTAQNSGSGSQDNSVTINNVHVNLPQGAKADATSGRALAKSLAKELQSIMKQERLRSGGKNLTLEDVILKL